MNTEDSEFARIEREQTMRNVPDAIHHTDTSETLEYITGWNDCRQAMLAAQQEPWLLESTQTLAKNLARKFYPEVTQWECLNDLAGVISQIDNMTTGLMRKPAQQEPCGYEHHEHRPYGAPGEVRIHAVLASQYKMPDGTIADDFQWLIDAYKADPTTIKLLPLYTTPQAQRKPLTDEQLRSMCNQTWVFETVKQWVRVIEAAHGIKENT